MFDLPLSTHRFLIEPLTGSPHVSRTLAKRYISFIDKVRNSNKRNLQQLLSIVQRDIQISIGYNLRSIMLLAGKKNIDELKANNFDIEYHKIQEYDSWKINFVQELVELRYGDLHVPGMTTEELQQILEHLCSN